MWAQGHGGAPRLCGCRDTAEPPDCARAGTQQRLHPGPAGSPSHQPDSVLSGVHTGLPLRAVLQEGFHLFRYSLLGN